MSTAAIQIISPDVAVKQIIETIRQANPGDAPFSLIVGAGFSSGLVPTAHDIVHLHLPRFDDTFVPTIYPPIPHGSAYFQLEAARRIEDQRVEEENKRRAACFWARFANENKLTGLQVPLNSAGLPADIQFAYKCAFDDNSIWPFKNKTEQRKFLNRLIRPNKLRLNSAHFLLASILGTQPSKDVPSKQQSPKKQESLFNFQSAFSRRIFTTNFDPFLQVALQAVNRLYYMSDTPDLVSDDLTGEQTDAIHLIYVHGSVHRHRQANSESQIAEIRGIAKDLTPVFSKYGLIIIGYSGWDDAIVEALTV